MKTKANHGESNVEILRGIDESQWLEIINDVAEVITDIQDRMEDRPTTLDAAKMFTILLDHWMSNLTEEELVKIHKEVQVQDE